MAPLIANVQAAKANFRSGAARNADMEDPAHSERCHKPLSKFGHFVQSNVKSHWLRERAARRQSSRLAIWAMSSTRH